MEDLKSFKIIFADKNIDNLELLKISKEIKIYEREKCFYVDGKKIMVTTYSSGIFSLIRDFLGKCKMRRFVERYLHAQMSGIPLPPLLACLEEKRGFKKRAFIFTPFINSPLNLRDFLTVDSLWKKYLPIAGDALRKIHSSGLSHGDFNTANILFNEQDEIFIIDWLRTKRINFLRKIIDFMRLELSLKQYKLFFLAYYGEEKNIIAFIIFSLSCFRRVYKNMLRRLKNILA